MALDQTRTPPRRRNLVRLAMLGGVVVLAMVVALAALVFAARRDEDAAVRALTDAARVHRLLDRTLQLIVDGETASRGYVLTGDATFLAPLEAAREELPGTLDALVATLTQEGDGEIATALREAAERRSELTDEIVVLAQRGDRDAATARIGTREGQRLTARLREQVAMAGGRADTAVDDSLERVEVSRTRARIAFLGLVVLATLIVLSLGLSVRENLSHAELAAETSRASELRFRQLAANAQDLIQVHALDRSISYVSPSCMKLLGYTAEELQALPFDAAVHEDDRGAYADRLTRALGSAGSVDPFSQRLRRKDGSVRSFSSRIDVVLGADGRPELFHTLHRDMTDSLRETERLADLAARDELTQLLNRRAFLEHGRALLARCRDEGTHALLFFCDVDGLKTINDALGHEAGDSVIRDAAALLRATARASDLTARLGGDEFAVLGAVNDPTGADAFAARLRARIVVLNEQGDRPYRVSVTVGSAVFDPTSRMTLDQLLAAADASMYGQKSGRGSQTTRSGASFLRDPSSR